jgi:uncharacterized protein (UPF0332 family)
VTAPASGLARAREEVRAARMLAESGFGTAAVSRSYFAAFCAAEAALLTLGETRSTHSGVVSGLAQIAVKRHGLDAEAGRILRSLFDRRSHADYGLSAVPAAEAGIAASDAERVVDLVEAWTATIG